MAATKEYPWKILALGRGQLTADKANKYLHDIGFKNALVVALENDHASDEKLIGLLKRQEWDGVSIGISICSSSTVKAMTLFFVKIRWWNKWI